MIFFFSAGGVLLKSTPSRVFQGSNKANTIYVVAPLSADQAVSVNFRLPDGTITNTGILSLCDTILNGASGSDKEVYSVWSYDVPCIVTARTGSVLCQFSFKNNEQTIKSEGVTFVIEKGISPTIETITDIDTLEEILAYLADINSKFLTTSEKIDGLDNIKNGSMEGSSQTYGVGEISSEKYEGSTANGKYSTAFNRRTKAFQKASHAEGNATIAGDEGGNQEAISAAHAEGTSTIATGVASHAEGVGTFSKARGSHAEGQGADAQGYASHAEGITTKTYQRSSHAEGLSTIAGEESDVGSEANNAAHAEGITTKAVKTASHAEGQSTQALNTAAHSEGLKSIAKGAYSHAEGQNTTTDGQAAHAEGQNTSAIDIAGHAEGSGTYSSQRNSHAEGQGTIAGLPPSVVLNGSEYLVIITGESVSIIDIYGRKGTSVKVNSNDVQAIGIELNIYPYGKQGELYSVRQANGETVTGWGYKNISFVNIENGEVSIPTYPKSDNYNAHAEGTGCIATGFSSHASGHGTITRHNYQTAVGIHNDNQEDNLFEVGNGNISYNAYVRKNAFVVKRNGAAEVQLQGTTDLSVLQVKTIKKLFKTYLGVDIVVPT